MADLAAISHRICQAIADADAHGATLAAEALRKDVAELQRLAYLAQRCDGCEYHPTPTIGATTDRIQSHG